MRAIGIASALAASVCIAQPVFGQSRVTAEGICLGTPQECAERLVRDQATVDEMTRLVINFAMDSAELTARQREKLAALADVLRKNRLRSVKFVVEGHTDSTGSDEYNRELSKRRADAVTAFLVASGIDASRLDPLGKGMNWPLVEDPFDPVNRRVELRLSTR